MITTDCVRCGSTFTDREERIKKWRICQTCRAAYKQKYMKDWRDNLRAQAIEILGGKCTTCGITDRRVLQIDHKNGGGSYDRTKGGIGTDMLVGRIVRGKRSIDDLQLLCANCHVIKTYHA